MRKEVPFSIGCAVIFVAAFFAFETMSAGIQNAASADGAIAQQETAITIATAVQVTAPIESVTSTTPTTPSTTPGLLPKVVLLPHKPTSAATVKKSIVAATPAVTAVPAPATITALTVLDATMLSFKEQPSGPYKMTLAANMGAGAMATWTPDAVKIGGTGTVPAFAAAFSCDPPPADSLFAVSTAYTCTLTLTPLAGSDLRSQSKTFSFTTGPGQLVVTLPLSMGTILANTETDGGLVFDNENATPITVTGLSLTVSYTALNTAYSPLVLRFLDPVTNTSIGDYPLQSLPADATLPYTHTGTVTVPLSFAVKATTQRMLPLKLLGVQTMNISNVNPAVTITINAVTTDPQSTSTVLAAAKIAWSCIVPVGAYDPNATSGPFATGQACR